MSYSQKDEEASLLEIFAGRETPGTLLDIGAYDGKTFSNSLKLIEMGWKAVLIEPSPTAFIALRETHKGREDQVMLVNALVGLDSHLTKFHDSPDLVGSTEETNYQKWKDDAEFYPPHYAMVVTPAQIANQLGGAFDLISIDTEGTSVPIFMDMLKVGFRPKVFIVEHDDRHVEVSNHAWSFGYRPGYMDGNNIILEKRA